MNEKKEATDKKPLSLIEKIKGSKAAMAGVVAGGIVAVLLVVFLIFFGYASSYQDILPGVSVNGVDVGGMSVSAATAKIESEFVSTLNDRAIVLTCEGNSKEISFSRLNVNADAVVLAEQAYSYGRTGGGFEKTFSMLSSIFGGKKLVGEVAYDTELYDSIIAELAGDKESKVQETEYTVEGNTLTIIKGHGGRQVDRTKADLMLREAFADPDITELTFVIEEAKPQDVDVDEFYAKLTQPPRDACYKLENGKVIVEKEIPQVIVDKGEIEKVFASDKDECTLTVETVQPQKTADQLSAMLFRDVIGSYSSNFATSSASRASNVELTAQRINDYILMPGDVFSYDKAVGTRTAANGYKSAGVYIGNRVESGIGGGICQTSSTLYSAVLYANLEIVERTSHSLPVVYVPGGMDATIAEGSIDFKFKNNTEYPIKIVATAVNRKLVCEIRGVKVPGQTVEIENSRTGSFEPQVTRTTSADVPAGYKKIVSKGAPGYKVASQRIVKMNGEVVKTERLTNSTYRATNTEEVVNPADADTPTESLKVYTDGMVIEDEGVIDLEQTVPDEGENEEAVETVNM